MKKLFIVSLSVLLIFEICTGCGRKKQDKKEIVESYNTNEGVIEDKVVDGLQLTNTSLVSYESSAKLVTKVTNTTDEDKLVKVFYIHVKDKNGNEIVKLLGYVGGVVPAGETREITSGVGMNLDKAYNIEYELVKD